MTRNSMLWEMYKEQCAFIRHHETQRSTVVNFIILIGGGLITVISGNGFSKSDLALAILLIFVGIFVLFLVPQILRDTIEVKDRQELIRTNWMIIYLKSFLVGRSLPKGDCVPQINR